MAKERNLNKSPQYLVIVVLFSIALVLILIYSLKISIKSTKNTSLVETGSELSIAVCDPANGPFSSEIDNPYFPQVLDSVKLYENDSEKVQITVLDETEIVAGVETRVVEEREWEGEELVEVSRNFYVQAPNGTVCYFGEDVDDYEDGEVVGHDGAWRAGEGENKPGIIMPADPKVGQKYQQEVAPGVAEDSAEHMAIMETYPAGDKTYEDVLIVKESPNSDKRYAKGIGLIFDDGLMLQD